MDRQFIISLSDLADQAVILPLSLAIAIFFWLIGWKRGAYGWLLAVFGTLSCVVISKFTFYLIQSFVRLPIALTSPSSHAAAGALVWGSLAALCLRGGRAGVRTAIATSGLCATLFSLTRLQLGVHTRSEVVTGSLIGVLGCVAFVVLAGRTRRAFYRVRLMALAATVVCCTWGSSLHAEHLIRSAAYVAESAIKHAFAHE
jgi:membrane-associated phospholipid phosphatase